MKTLATIALTLAMITAASAQQAPATTDGLTDRLYQECGERMGVPGAIAGCVLEKEEAFGKELGVLML
jgi:hypothetical protein